jgi:nicotinamidase-related amidase
VTEDGNDVKVTDTWAIITRFSTPAPARFVRDITVFVREPSGCWRRDDERHENVLVDTATVPGLLVSHGVEATVRSSFGIEELPVGLKVIVGKRWIPSRRM